MNRRTFVSTLAVAGALLVGFRLVTGRNGPAVTAVLEAVTPLAQAQEVFAESEQMLALEVMKEINAKKW